MRINQGIVLILIGIAGSISSVLIDKMGCLTPLWTMIIVFGLLRLNDYWGGNDNP